MQFLNSEDMLLAVVPIFMQDNFKLYYLGHSHKTLISWSSFAVFDCPFVLLIIILPDSFYHLPGNCIYRKIYEKHNHRRQPELVNL